MQTIAPIKRHSSLQPISREHHHALLLVWKIRKGISNKIDSRRIAKYVDWFYKAYIISHLDLEEKYVYPILGSEHELIIKATDEHTKLRNLFSSLQKNNELLLALAALLENHIRFEERTLFSIIQQSATDNQLQSIEKYSLAEKFVENEDDQFWQ